MSGLRRKVPSWLWGTASRLLAMAPVLFGVTLVTFFILDVLPGSAGRQLLGAEATEEQVAALEAELGLDQPVHRRYWQWLQGVATGDLGRSLASKQPVGTMISDRIPVTFELAVFAFVLTLLISVPAALAAAHRPNRLTRRVTALVSMGALSFASYVLAVLLVLLFSVALGLFPSIGFTPLSENVFRNLQSLTLPALALAIPIAGAYTRFLQGDLEEQLKTQDYVSTALAKGLSGRRVLLRHVLPNSSFGLLTLTGLNFGVLMGGTVIVEQIFSLPGTGQLLLQSIALRDAAVVQGIVLILVCTTVAANLVVDLLYVALDPRIRLAAA